MMKPIVKVCDVNFSYVINNGGSRNLKETILSIFKRTENKTTIQALVDVNFELFPGDVLAVVGKNGSGKSTLLKVLARILPPSSGSVTVEGKIAPMIELGAGFHPELTGRENITLLGVLLGGSIRDMKSKVLEIASWAGTESVLDLPVRTYSTGMTARLAFAIATSTKSSLLVIDEILSVGDRDFQARSFSRIIELIDEGEVTVLVSHDLDLVRKLANKSLWIESGRQIAFGTTNEVLEEYEKN